MMSRFKRRRELRAQEEDAKKLQEDREKCAAELKPILDKYNLIIAGRVRHYEDGLVALAVLARPQQKAAPQSFEPAEGSSQPAQ